MLFFPDLTNITHSRPLQNTDPARIIRYLVTDSRKAIISEESLFFAIRGGRHDGHHFIKPLYAQGIRQFVVEQLPETALSDFPGANILQVSDVVEALQAVAAFHRKQFTIPVAGITGSNGKTVVKEWLGQLLAPHEYVVKNPKSYNSQIGVPLSVWEMSMAHQMGIFEAGISLPGEMEKLEKIIRPTMGIFTNIGPAHDEGFESRVQKVEEKAKLFAHCPVVIYCSDYTAIHNALKAQQKAFPEKQLVSWTKTKQTDAFAQLLTAEKHISRNETNLTIAVQQKGQHHFTLPFTDDASIENGMHCIVYMLYHGFDAPTIQRGLQQLRKLSMRMELKQGINNCYLVDDSYSNDLAGLQIALDFLVQQKKSNKYTVILSDLVQSGEAEADLYGKVAHMLQSRNIQKFIGVGKGLSSQQQVFYSLKNITCTFYENTEALLESINPTTFHNEVILIKGARQFGFERIVDKLQQRIHGTVLEINLDALTHNLNFYRSKLPADTKMMVMVKAFSYGGGSFEIANLLQFHRVDYLAVAYADEGITLRENGIHLPIMVMNPSPDQYGKMGDYRLEPEIYSLRTLKAFLQFCSEKDDENIPSIHLKIDTGMHRLGFQPEEMDELINLLKLNSQVKVASIFSHLSGADEAKFNTFSHQQAEVFQQCYKQITSILGEQPMRHMLNSAGILRFPEYHWDMVRLGIGLYGEEVSGLEKTALQPISTLKTVISQIKHIKKGETIGYSRRGVAEHAMKIATIAIGYADGFGRKFGNGNARVLIRNQSAPTIGNICMDMSMVDISHIKGAQEGDEVIIFGPALPVQTLAEKANTMPYEILTGVSERVKRIYYAE